MNNAFVSSKRIVCIDQAVAHDLESIKLNNRQFVRLVAFKKRFVNCNFRNSTFEACYLRKCVFESCDFSGCHFERCQLPDTSFDGCIFDYATFDSTSVEREILRTGCPGTENLQMRFARTLRTNFQGLGDADAANEAILIELAATEVHLRKAAFSRESYYRSKYKGLRRAAVVLAWMKFRALEFIWGNGEKPTKLLRTLFFLIVGMAIFDVINFRDSSNVGEYIQSFLLAPKVLLGAVTPTEYGSGYLALIAFARLTVFALLISIIVKRFHRR